MSQNIINEVYFFAGSLLMGVVITFVYDFLLILRRVMIHHMFWISLEDFMFWMSCAIGVFYMLYEENNGILRWFAVLAAALGMLLYKRIIGVRFVCIAASVIEKELHIICKILEILLRPFCRGGKQAGKVLKYVHKKQLKIFKYVKKQLTGLVKVLKITLSKH